MHQTHFFRRFAGVSARAAGKTRSVALLLAVVTAAIGGPVIAQNFPTRTIRIPVPYQPAGVVDYAPRLIAERMAADLGQAVIIENKPGGLGLPAMSEVLKAPSDGHTILSADAAQWAINPALQQVSYDFLRDFAPVSLLFTNGLIVVSGGSSGINSLQDLIARAKANPGKLNYATPGIGTLHHLAFEVLRASLGLDVKHIPYKGTAEQTDALRKFANAARISGAKAQ